MGVWVAPGHSKGCRTAGLASVSQSLQQIAKEHPRLLRERGPENDGVRPCLTKIAPGASMPMQGLKQGGVWRILQILAEPRNEAQRDEASW